MRRLLREAHGLSELRHPGIVNVLDAGITTDGAAYLAMELLEGKTVDALVSARGRLPLVDALIATIELCETVATAHARGVLHRDIKPSNVFVVRAPNEGERTKLLDFGTSKAAPIVDTKLTDEGSVVGTPAYMAPEQLMAAGDLDARADVYSLGALLYECLAGRTVYPGNYAAVVRAAYSTDPVPAMRAPGVDAALEQVIVKALAKDRASRYASTTELADALRPFVPAGAVLRLLQSAADTQRRRHERAPFLAPVSLRDKDQQAAPIDGRCEDISESGMLFLSRDECVASREYELRFGAPVSGRVTSFRARAQWVRARPAGGWAVGLEFIDPPKELVNDISVFVRLMKQPSVLELEPDSTVMPQPKATVLDTPAARRR
jgi:serine/threonine protein kinase